MHGAIQLHDCVYNVIHYEFVYIFFSYSWCFLHCADFVGVVVLLISLRYCKRSNAERKETTGWACKTDQNMRELKMKKKKKKKHNIQIHTHTHTFTSRYAETLERSNDVVAVVDFSMFNLSKMQRNCRLWMAKEAIIIILLGEIEKIHDLIENCAHRNKNSQRKRKKIACVLVKLHLMNLKKAIALNN